MSFGIVFWVGRGGICEILKHFFSSSSRKSIFDCSNISFQIYWSTNLNKGNQKSFTIYVNRNNSKTITIKVDKEKKYTFFYLKHYKKKVI